MRDYEFIEAFERLTPKLDRFFSKGLRTFHGDSATEVDDLIQETGKKALENSRLSQYSTYTCDRLIFEKAYNLLYEYRHPPQKKVPALSLEEVENHSSGQDPYRDVVNRKWLESIYEKVDRTTWIICYLVYAGYKYEEISLHLGISIGMIKMRIHRLRRNMK